MSVLTTPNLIGAGALLIVAGILGILWLTRDKAPKTADHRIEAAASHRAQRATRTFRLGGVVGALVDRAPAPALAAVPAPADNSVVPASLYPEPGSPAVFYAHTMRAVGARTGTTSRFEDTSTWEAITDPALALMSAAEPQPEPVPATNPQPVLIIEDAPAAPVLDGKAEQHMTAFLEAHDEQDAAEAAPDAESDPAEAEKDRMAFETGCDL